MGFVFSKSMNENMKIQQEFMLMNARLQLERQLVMQNDMRERQMAMQIAWSREVLKYFGTFFSITTVFLTAGAMKRKKPAFLFPIVPLSFILTYQYDLGYGTLLQRMKEIVPSDIDQDAEPLTMMLEFNPNLLQELKAMGSERSSSLLNLQHNGPAFKDSSLSFEKFKNTIPNKQNEAEDNSPSEQKHLGLEPHSRKKRQSDTSLSRQCCQVGCTRRSIAKFC
uniref:prorelaxin H2 isoform X1 n=1 Tax=Jaculus jaculus TaxID=51337 RepID=UPI001E1B3DDC|nr:prorelaxin H2 isoform X1 [Jaculus jaculus]XP_044990520.1 prorelaxin H2 isoform X1 [Jaculus jaculus]XP_044990528.1 prorelaxin H2 isoform X1 [Jaculus jaculus]